MPQPATKSSAKKRASLATALLGGGVLMFGFAGAAHAQSSCGTPPSGLVRLWAGIGCVGQTADVTASGPVADFPAFSISNGTGQWIAVTDTADPAQANHTLLIENGCYYGDLSLFHWQSGRSWVGNIRSIQILPPGTDPNAYPAANKVIGQCS